MITKKVLSCCLFFLSSTLLAQTIAEFDEEAIEDDFIYNLNLYGEEYIKPVIDGYGTSITVGWDGGMPTLSPWAVSVNLVAATAFTPSNNLTFDFNSKPFTDNFYLKNPSNSEMPTVLGGEANQTLVYEVEGQTALGSVTYSEEFPAPSGTTTPFNSTPSVGLLTQIGLPEDLEVAVRLFPPVSFAGVRHFQTGIGARHLISRYFLSDDSPLSVSLGVYYNYSNFSTDADEYLEGENKKITLSSHTFTANASLAYQVGPLSLFTRIGYFSTQNTFAIKGTYRFEVEDGALVQEAFEVKDPVSIQKSNGSLRLECGAGVTFLDIMQFSAGYQLAVYNTAFVRMGVVLNGKED